MISLQPTPYSSFVCPVCQSENQTVTGTILQGIHWLAEVKCADCATDYLADFPTGHALFFPGSWISEKNQWKLKTEFEAPWFQKPVSAGFANPRPEVVSVKRIQKRHFKQVILLNCLDYLYGHVLLKLWNAHSHLQEQPSFGLIVMIPESFEWLVPEGVAEIWSIPLKLKDCQQYFPSINIQIQQWISEYETVKLSLAHSHPDPAELPVQNYTGVSPFPVTEFCSRPPVITFIYREDRLWLSNQMQDFAWMLATKYQLQSIKQYLLSVQKSQILAYFETIHAINPQIEIRITGLGQAGGFPVYVKDLRKTRLTAQDEKDWCVCYAESQLVVGIHGSNMLLPTAHAAGFIEILPKARWGNLMQDIASRNQGRILHFLGRFTEEFISPKQLAILTTEIFRQYPFFELSMDKRFLEHSMVSDVSLWTGFRKKYIPQNK